MIKLYSREAEDKLLGLIIKEPNLMTRIRGIISTQDFYLEENRYLFSEMVRFEEEGRDIEQTSLLDYLENYSIKSREDWDIFLTELVLSAGIEAHIEKYISTIKDKTQARKLELALKDSLDFVSLEHTSISELVGKIEGRILDVTKDRELRDFDSIENITNEYRIKLKDIRENGYQEGILTKIRSLDELLGGLKEGELIIVAARPSMGKTAFALEISKNIAKERKVGFFSIEMPKEQLLQRLISSEALLTNKDIRNINKLGQDQQEQILHALEKVKDLNLWIDDSPQGKIEELTWKARKLNDLVGLDLIVIDYLQLLETANRKENRQQQVSDISRALKQLSRELKIPVIALSQLSRGVEGRQEKRPMMSDIRESGSIEQDADAVLMLYRENYYQHDKSSLGPIQELQVIVAKNRNGPTGLVRLNINLEMGRIKDKGNNN